MQKVLHRAEKRGVGNHGWLQSRFSFSFADWYEPTRMGFGALRVINDDVIAPDSGFGMHGHKDMEIITIVMQGAVTHKDSMGNMKTVPAGDVQVMSAGTGVMHSEYNASETEPLKLFQIWIQPNTLGIPPRYAQQSFDFVHKKGITTLVAPAAELSITQDAYLSYAVVDADSPIEYEVHTEGNGVYVFVVEGSPVVQGEQLNSRDALGISETKKVVLSSSEEAKVLIIEIPVSI